MEQIVPLATLPDFVFYFPITKASGFQAYNSLRDKQALLETISTAEWEMFYTYCSPLNSHLCLNVFQIINITMAAPKYQEQRLVRQPVDITFTVRGSKGYVMGSEVSNALMKLTMVEFSYYMGFPVLQIAEREYYKVISPYSRYMHLLIHHLYCYSCSVLYV